METKGVPLNQILQQLMEIDKRDAANFKKIKECEATVKHEEENIQQLQELKCKLNLELKTKLQKNSQNETTHEILQQEKIIWLEFLDKTRDELKNEEAKLISGADQDSLQQNICMNRISFCDNMKEFFDKHNLSHISYGFAGKSTVPKTTNTIKTEVDAEEYGNLLDKIQSLHNELEEIKAEEAQIEESKRLKMRLQAEPSSGENFLRLQKALKNIKDEQQNLETEITKIKSNIAQTELKLLDQRCKKSDIKPQQSADTSTQITKGCINNEKIAIPKLVRFKRSVEVQSVASTPQTNTISKYKTSTPNLSQTITPSPNLRKQLKRKTVSILDEEMELIIFKKKH